MDASEPFTVDTVLAPVDGSDESATAVEYAVAVADRYDASVHALFVLGRGVVRGLDAGTVDETAVAENTQGFFDDIGVIAADADVPLATSVDEGFSQTRKTRHPATSCSTPPTRSTPTSSSSLGSRLPKPRPRSSRKPPSTSSPTRASPSSRSNCMGIRRGQPSPVTPLPSPARRIAISCSKLSVPVDSNPTRS